MLTFTIILLILFFVGCFPYNQECGFPKEKTNLLKAILPFFILFHHANGEVLIDFIPAGKFVVAVFFCISGYGKETKFIQTGHLSTRDLCYRQKSLFLPTIVPILFYSLVLFYMQKDVVGIFHEHFTDVSMPLPNSWFIVVLALLYCLFFITCKFTRKQNGRVLVLSALVLILNLVFFFFFREQTWLYASNFAFVVGVVLKMKENSVKQLIQHKVAKVILPLSLIASYLLIPVRPFAIINISLYALVVLLMTYLVPINKTGPVLRYLGRISYEIYLCHGIIIMLFSKCMFSSYALYIIAVIISTLVLSVMCNYTTSLLQKLSR